MVGTWPRYGCYSPSLKRWLKGRDPSLVVPLSSYHWLIWLRWQDSVWKSWDWLLLGFLGWLVWHWIALGILFWEFLFLRCCHPLSSIGAMRKNLGTQFFFTTCYFVTTPSSIFVNSIAFLFCDGCKLFSLGIICFFFYLGCKWPLRCLNFYLLLSCPRVCEYWTAFYENI